MYSLSYIACVFFCHVSKNHCGELMQMCFFFRFLMKATIWSPNEYIEHLLEISSYVYCCYLRADKGIEKAKQITVVALPLAIIGTFAWGYYFATSVSKSKISFMGNYLLTYYLVARKKNTKKIFLRFVRYSMQQYHKNYSTECCLS